MAMLISELTWWKTRDMEKAVSRIECVDHTFSQTLAKRPYLGHCESTSKRETFIGRFPYLASLLNILKTSVVDPRHFGTDPDPAPDLPFSSLTFKRPTK
jgi:hypothetical protein